MKNINLLCVLLLFMSCIGIAQSKYFEISYNWDDNNNSNGWSILINNAGNYVIGGNTKDDSLFAEDFRPFLLEMNKEGQILSVHEYIHPSNYPSSILDFDYNGSEYFLGGWIASPNPNVYYMLLDLNFNLLKVSEIGSYEFQNNCQSVCKTSDNGYLLGGQYGFTAPTDYSHPYLIKTDSTGHKQWDTIYYNYGNPYNSWIRDIQPDPDGGYYLIGSTTATGFIGDILLMKIDEQGNELWHEIYDYNLFGEEAVAEWGGSILVCSGEGLLVSSVHQNYLAFPIKPRKTILIKLDTSRNIEWDTFYNTDFDGFQAARVIQATDEGFVFAGLQFPTSASNNVKAILARTDANGNLLWKRLYDYAGFDNYFYDLIGTPDGDFIACGRTEYYDFPAGIGQANLYIVKTNCMGLLTEPEAAFAYEPLGSNEIQFTNQTLYAYPDSIDGGYYRWDWGDGSPPYLCGQGYDLCSGNILTHQYPASGTYTTTLTAIVCSDTSLVQAQIDTEGGGGTVGLPPDMPPPDPLKGEKSLQVYPNPATNTLTFQQVSKSPSGDLGVNGAGDLEIKLHTLTGQTALQTTLAAGETNKTISVAHLPVGMYLYEAEQSGSVLARGKVAVVR
ncbi:MAG: T9SS type A sorting domain-containing protein [Sphingobacteriales bacterium]|nr:MAG: T9SS type A sorting domain-containing protein [Sphingobacteriales bacterium]